MSFKDFLVDIDEKAILEEACLTVLNNIIYNKNLLDDKINGTHIFDIAPIPFTGNRYEHISISSKIKAIRIASKILYRSINNEFKPHFKRMLEIQKKEYDTILSFLISDLVAVGLYKNKSEVREYLYKILSNVDDVINNVFYSSNINIDKKFNNYRITVV